MLQQGHRPGGAEAGIGLAGLRSACDAAALRCCARCALSPLGRCGRQLLLAPLIRPPTPPLHNDRQFLRQLLAPERKNTCVAAARRESRELLDLQSKVGPDRLVITRVDVADEGSVKAWAKGLADKVR